MLHQGFHHLVTNASWDEPINELTFRRSGTLPDIAKAIGRELRGLEEIEELLTDQVSDRLLETEGLADVAGGLALLDPDLVELDHWGSADSIPPGDGPGLHGDSPE